MKYVFIKTFGCQMNEQDSRQMYALLAGIGFEKTEDMNQADLVFLNTCSIRAKAEQKIYSELGRLRPLKEKNKDLIIGVTGCVAQQEKEVIAKKFPSVDIVIGPDQVRKISNIVEQIISERKDQKNKIHCLTAFEERQDYEFLNVVPLEKTIQVKSFVNIQKGCDNFCAYCIVPFVRGREVSRSSKDIIDEINKLTDRGVKEVTLLGQNVNSYGQKDGFDETFSMLLHVIAEQTPLKRLRFATSHPKDMSDELINEFATNPILAPQLHLPLQSGSDRILKLMNRNYTQEHYLNLVKKLKKAKPGICLSTDLIVGFPTETEEDFQQTLKVMQDVGYVQTFSFVYSPRPYTAAAKIKDAIPLSLKKERLQILQNLDQKITLSQNQNDVGRKRQVLVESVETGGTFSIKGRTEHNKIVHIKAEKACFPGDFVDVMISKANPHSLFGEMA